MMQKAARVVAAFRHLDVGVVLRVTSVRGVSASQSSTGQPRGSRRDGFDGRPRKRASGTWGAPAAVRTARLPAT